MKICERCNADDGRDVRERKVQKGEAAVKRLLCDECAQLTSQTYATHPLPRVRAQDAEARP